jgi:CubicO group peptidase (beta-lactamase class C family)
MAEVEIKGVCPERFSAVRDAFAANFAQDRELGARFALAIEGEIVVDIWAGYADRKRTVPYDERTLTPIFSTTKAVTSTVFARAVGEGLIDYRQPVAELWPDFAQAGKGAITVEQCLSHQDGLAAVIEPTEPQIWFDWDAACALLAGMAPLWEPGTASGYHPTTFGYTVGEIFRRATGRTIGEALRKDFAGPFGLDIWIGLPDSEHGRVADMQKPPGPAKLGELTPIKRAAFLQAWSAPGGRGTADWRRAEIPSANGHATAPALARLLALMACDGRLDGHQLLAKGIAADAGRSRIKGQDLVLPFVVSWGAGFLRNEGLDIYGPGAETFGHSGWGGSCAFADPQKRVSGAYVMNRQSQDLIGDPRAVGLIEAAYRGL